MTNQLRIRVAEAMGWTEIGNNGFGFNPVPLRKDGLRYKEALPNFLEDANAALLLVARLKEQGLWLDIDNSGEGEWTWTVSIKATELSAQGPTFELAICAAFLAVIKATQGETKL